MLAGLRIAKMIGLTAQAHFDALLKNWADNAQPPYKRGVLPLIFVLAACNTCEQVGSSSFSIQYCSRKAAALIFFPLTTMLFASST
jgi:hypothetical protein